MYSDGMGQSQFDAMYRKKQLEKDINFQREMSECMENLKRMPHYKEKVWQKVVEMHNTFEEERGQQGLLAGQMAQRRLRNKLRAQREKEA